MEMRKSVFLFLLAPIFSFAFDEHRPWTYQLWDLEAQTAFYKATANYTRSGGSFDRLPGNNSYQLLTVDLRVRYVLTRSWALSAGLQIANAESKNAVTTRTNSAITEAHLSLERLLSRKKNYDLIAEFFAVAPLEKVSPSDDEVLTGEGAMQVGGRLFARARWGFFRPFLFAGFTYRDGGRSSLIPYGIGTEFKIGQNFIGGEARGYTSASKDDYTDAPANRESVSLRNGEALRFYTVNPQLLEGFVWWRNQPLKGIGLKVMAGTSLTGAATAAGYSLSVNLNYRFTSEGEGEKPSTPQQKFEIPTEDGVDQSLFEEPPPAAKE
jgi:hypothetical protein